MKVLLIGRHEILFEVGKRLLNDKQHEIAAVVTAPSQPEYQRREKDFEDLAAQAGAPFLVTRRIDEDVLSLVDTTAPEIGVSVNWVSIIESSLIERLDRGVLNCHLGDLPRYRGNAVPNWAMLAGEKDITLTIHAMEAGELDAGPILAKQPFQLRPETTITEIIAFGVSEAPGLFASVLDRLAEGTLHPIPQSDVGSTAFRCHPRLPRDGLIDWSQSARQIDALVRSLAPPYSGAYTYQRTQESGLVRLTVLKSRVVVQETDDMGVPGHIVRNDPNSGESWVFTGKGILAITEVADEGRRAFAPGRVWRSTRRRLGLSIEDEIYRLHEAANKGASE